MQNAVAQSLDLMWKGMLSIFVVIACIFIVTLVIGHIRKKEKNSEIDPKEESRS